MSKKGYSDKHMQKWWRKAVLRANCYTCAVCGLARSPEYLEAHHLVKRSNRILRHDWRNGVAVCVGDCHRFADTAAGTAQIMANHPHSDYLTSTVRRYRTVKDFLRDLGLTQAEYDAETLERLKTVASGGHREAS